MTAFFLICHYPFYLKKLHLPWCYLHLSYAAYLSKQRIFTYLRDFLLSHGRLAIFIWRESVHFFKTDIVIIDTIKTDLFRDLIRFKLPVLQ